MKIKEIRTSFSSDDEVPLKYYDNNEIDRATSIRRLYERSIESCEFCDKAFNNRYKSLIHNATHIIIPLLNQKIQQCEECLFCFTTQDDLQHHINIKHPNIVKNETDLVKSIERTDKKVKRERLKNRIKFEDDEDLFNVSAELLDDLTTDCTVKLATSDLVLLNESGEVKNSNKNFVINIDISDNEDDNQTYKNKYVFGKHRSAAYEDFAEENKVYNSFVNSFSKNNELVLEFEEAAVEDYKEVNGFGNVEEYFESIHYDVLRKPQIVKCRHCKRKFPDRYELLIHEISHITFNRSLPYVCVVCDWYIDGDSAAVKRHMMSHPPDASKSENSSKCLKCGLLYRRYTLHCNNYHRSNNDVLANDKYDKIIEICDLCFDFLKSSQYRHYIKIGSVSRIGHRYKCSRCLRKFFELHRVKKTQVKQNWKMEKRTFKKLTNNQRLKNIQHRLKNINKMTKF